MDRVPTVDAGVLGVVYSDPEVIAEGRDAWIDEWTDIVLR